MDIKNFLLSITIILLLSIFSPALTKNDTSPTPSITLSTISTSITTPTPSTTLSTLSTSITLSTPSPSITLSTLSTSTTPSTTSPSITLSTTSPSTASITTSTSTGSTTITTSTPSNTFPSITPSTPSTTSSTPSESTSSTPSTPSTPSTTPTTLTTSPSTGSTTLTISPSTGSTNINTTSTATTFNLTTSSPQTVTTTMPVMRRCVCSDCGPNVTNETVTGAPVNKTECWSPYCFYSVNVLTKTFHTGCSPKYFVNETRNCALQVGQSNKCQFCCSNKDHCNDLNATYTMTKCLDLLKSSSPVTSPSGMLLVGMVLVHVVGLAFK